MKYALFTLLLAGLFIPGISYADEYWGNIEHGSSQTIGKFEYYSDGTSSQHIGIFCCVFFLDTQVVFSYTSPIQKGILIKRSIIRRAISYQI